MSSELETRVVAIIEGRADQVGQPPPLMPLDDHFSAVKRAWSTINAAWPVSGRAIAAAHGYRTLPRRPPRLCGEGENNGVIAYDPDLPPEWRSFLACHGMTHPELRRRIDPYTHSDNWLQTALLLVPPAVVRTTRSGELLERAPCPRAITAAVVDLVHRADWISVGISG